MNTATPSLAKVLRRAARYNNLGLAIQGAAHGVKPLRVMLGDDGKFWVVTPADAARLEAAGYEYAGL